MKKVELMNKVSRTFNNVGFQFKKYSPEILIAAGVVGTVASAVMACKATTKIGDILDETKSQVNKIHETVERVEAGEVIKCEDKNGNITTYEVEDSKKDLTIVYVQAGLKFAKLYAPAVGLGMLSLGCILKSNDILRKRNVALAAAYATVDKGFKEYRSRVVERFGETVDRELKYNVKAEEIMETVVDEKGKEKTVKKTIDVINPNVYSEYARFFDETNPNYEENAEFNKMFLLAQQNHANHLLRTKKRVFLNEVYEMLGFEPSKAGQMVGWVYDPKNEDSGDNYIDFGIFEYHRANQRFVNGYEPVILLDFNVDGNVWKSM